jgi:predicted O-methyltransferase YrrM
MVDMMPFSREEAEQFSSYARRIRDLSISLGIPSISEAEGEILYSITYLYASINDSGIRVVDAGAGIGYSTLWFARALLDAKCNICLIEAVEKNKAFAQRIKSVLKEAGLDVLPINIITHDAVEYIMNSKPESIDILFVDIEKNRYPRILEEAIYKLKKGGLIIFHNALFPPPPTRLYEVIHKYNLMYTIVPSENGILVVYKG